MNYTVYDRAERAAIRSNERGGGISSADKMFLDSAVRR